MGDTAGTGVDKDAPAPNTLQGQHMDNITHLIKESLLPKLPFSAEAKDPSEYRAFFRSSSSPVNIQQRTDNLRHILGHLHQLKSKEKQKSLPEQQYSFLADLILLLGEQRDGSKPWSSPQAAAIALEIEAEIVSNSNSEDLEAVFLSDFKQSSCRKSLFHKCLKGLKPKLKLDEWKFHPGAKYTFSWILKSVKYPYLSDFVDEVLPPSLLLTDDYNSENIILGLDALIHCVENINRAELQRNNWSLVIYDALHKLIHEKDLEIIGKLGRTLLLSLNLVEQNPAQNCHQFTKYDDTLKKLLFVMEFSSDKEQKKVWLSHLISFVDTMGHGTLHWIDRINSLLLSYTTSSDPQLWLAIILVIETCIKNSWTKPSSPEWIEIIFRIIFNQSALQKENSEEDKVESEIKCKIQDCLELMRHCEDWNRIKEQIEQVLHAAEDNKKLHSHFLLALKQYF